MSDESLLVRWSRRKRAAQQGLSDEEPAPVADAPKTPADDTAQAAAVARDDKAPVDDAPVDDAAGEPEIKAEDLPDLETLTYESDFSVFMQKGVPEFVKQQALRKLWLSNPILANLDGLNDYDPKSMSFLIQDMEGAAEPIAEIGRGLRDKIMEAKHARDDRPRGRRTPRSGQDRRHDFSHQDRSVVEGKDAGGNSTADEDAHDERASDSPVADNAKKYDA